METLCSNSNDYQIVNKEFFPEVFIKSITLDVIGDTGNDDDNYIITLYYLDRINPVGKFKTINTGINCCHGGTETFPINMWIFGLEIKIDEAGDNTDFSEYPPYATVTAEIYYKIATIKEASEIGETSAESNKCILRSELSTYGCGLKATALDYTINQAVRYCDIEKSEIVNQCILRVVPYPSSVYGTTTGQGVYSQGDSVSIKAIPNLGYTFLQWLEGELNNNPRTVTVNSDAEYHALFYKNPTGELRIVDLNLNLYTYDEYRALSTKPDTIGVAIETESDWLVYYKNYKPQQALGTGNDLGGYSDVLPSTSLDLLYPHSGKASSDWYKTKFPNSLYAAFYVSTLTDGGLEWYIPNLYELTLIFSKTTNVGVTKGFDSHFSLIGGDQIMSTLTYSRSHWTSDVGYGSSKTDGKVLPYRVYYLGNNQLLYMSSGNYCYLHNDNFIRPVARIPFS